jgi:hypothetical protein
VTSRARPTSPVPEVLTSSSKVTTDGGNDLGGGGRAHDQREHDPTAGQGPPEAAIDDVQALLDDLHRRGLGHRGWTAADTSETGVHLRRHGRRRLLDAALAGRPPDTLRGALTRWRDLPAPRPATPDVRCSEHHQTHPATSECPGCRADRLLDTTAVPEEPELTDEQAERAAAVLRRVTRGAA